MVMERNECCGCASGGYPCMGDVCSKRHAKYLCCDHCREDCYDELYKVEGGWICASCVKKYYPSFSIDELETMDFQDIVAEM